MNKKHIVLWLVLISLVSLGLKLYTFDPSVLPSEDTYGYVLRGIAHNNGDFSEHPRKTLGWSIMISPFLHFVESDNFLDYINVARYLGLTISMISIYPMYLLGRRFFDEKFSLCAAGFFAFEPHLNHHASSGYSEPVIYIYSNYNFIHVFYFEKKFQSCLSFLCKSCCIMVHSLVWNSNLHCIINNSLFK